MLPVSTVKFDKSLIQKITDDRRSYELLYACQHMADALKLESVAEGIETEEQKRKVQEMGVTCQQGFLLRAQTGTKVWGLLFPNTDNGDEPQIKNLKVTKSLI